MIYKMSRDLGLMLITRKFPIRVEFGPERTARDAASDSVIVVERDFAASDAFDFTHGVNPNARRSSSRGLAAVATIYARSSLPGVRPSDHEDFCETLLDALLISLNEWVKQATGVEFGVSPGGITDGRYVPIDSAEEIWPGVKYVLKFRIPRGVSKRDYDGNARPTGTPAGIETTRNVG